MNTPGRRKATDNIVPTGGGAAMRGALLIALAVVLGIALLANSFDTDSGAASTNGGETDSTDDGGGGGEGGDTSSTAAPPSTHAPAEVKVWVLNGSGQPGVARTGTDRLIPLGYTTNSPGNSAAVPASVVYALPGYEGDAANIATALGLPATAVQPMPTPPPVENGDLQGSQVLAVLGPDFQIDPTATTAATPTTATGN